MPRYEFECGEHGKFEVAQPMMATHKAVCPQCGLDGRRLFSAPAMGVSKELIHTDSGIPQSVHDALTNTKHEEFDMAKARQGGVIDPEDLR